MKFDIKNDDIAAHDISGTDKGWMTKIAELCKKAGWTIEKFVYAATDFHYAGHPKYGTEKARRGRAHVDWNAMTAKKNARVANHLRRIAAHLLDLLRSGKSLPIVPA